MCATWYELMPAVPRKGLRVQFPCLTPKKIMQDLQKPAVQVLGLARSGTVCKAQRRSIICGVMGMFYVGTLLFSCLKGKETSTMIDSDLLLLYGKRLFYRSMSVR